MGFNQLVGNEYYSGKLSTTAEFKVETENLKTAEKNIGGIEFENGKLNFVELKVGAEKFKTKIVTKPKNIWAELFSE
ncbi:MAG: hypothetical protein V3U92_15290 [Cellulophaga sp.]